MPGNQLPNMLLVRPKCYTLFLPFVFLYRLKKQNNTWMKQDFVAFGQSHALCHYAKLSAYRGFDLFM